MNIIITGANGFIARNLAKNLDNNDNVILLSHTNIKFFFLKKFKCFRFNLKKNIIPKLSCDILIHAAAITPQKNYKATDYKNINFESLKKIIKNINIKKKIIFLSTTDIYKNQNKKIVKEIDKINIKKISSYAKSKYNSENYLKNLNKNKFPFEKIILRLPGIIGQDNHNNFISNISKNILDKKNIIYYGGQNLFNNVYHVKSLINLIKKLICHKIKSNFEIINIGTNNPIKIKKIFTLINSNNLLLVRKKNVENKNDMFSIDVSKLNKYYKKIDTKTLLRKFFNENKFNKIK